jgi:hypothetical protein
MNRAVPALLVALMLAFVSPALPAQTYTVLTYNVGLLRTFGSDLVPVVEARAKAAPSVLARFAADTQPQIILLEEIWRDAYARAIADGLAPLGYAAVAPRVHSLIGLSSGLLLLVRAPLVVESWSFSPFRRTTFVDSFARKGVLQATLRDGTTGARFALIGTHTVAVDTNSGTPKDSGQVAAINAQAAEVRAALDSRSEHGSVAAIMLGDLNVGPGYVDDVYRIFADGLTDAGASADSPLITWDPGNPLVKYGGYPNEPPSRIDHVFVRAGAKASWTVIGARVVLQAPVPGLQLVPKGRSEAVAVPLSDHYGFLAEIRLQE